jgi:hypothetical protein
MRVAGDPPRTVVDVELQIDGRVACIIHARKEHDQRPGRTKHALRAPEKKPLAQTLACLSLSESRSLSRKEMFSDALE